MLVVIKSNWFLAEDSKNTMDFMRLVGNNNVISSPIETLSDIGRLQQTRLASENKLRKLLKIVLDFPDEMPTDVENATLKSLMSKSRMNHLLRSRREFTKRQNSFSKSYPMKDTLHTWEKLWLFDHMTKKNWGRRRIFGEYPVGFPFGK